MITPVSQDYDPGRLLTALQDRLNLHSDTALSKALNISPVLIAQLRERRRPVAGALLIRMHEVSRLSVADLRGLMGDRRRTCRMPIRLNQDTTWQTVIAQH